MTRLLERITTPTAPGALLQALHPGLGFGLPGARPRGSVVGYDPVPGGSAVELSLPGWWNRPSGTDEPAQGVTALEISVDVRGVRHRDAFEVVALRRSAGGVACRVTALVPDGAQGPVASRVRHAATGERFEVGPGQMSARHDGPDAGNRPSEGCTSADRRAVRFTGSDVLATAEGDDTVLQVALDAGLDPTTGCRRGVCHRCATRLRSGSTSNSRDGTVGAAGDTIRICVSRPIVDVEVEL